MLARGKRPPSTLPEKIPLLITFCPPTKARRDIDNMLASIKAALDGVAEAWGVDDSRFRPSLDIGPVVKHGAIKIEILGVSP